MASMVTSARANGVPNLALRFLFQGVRAKRTPARCLTTRANFWSLATTLAHAFCVNTAARFLLRARRKRVSLPRTARALRNLPNTKHQREHNERVDFQERGWTRAFLPFVAAR